jgi:hypothetical protein
MTSPIVNDVIDNAEN